MDTTPGIETALESTTAPAAPATKSAARPSMMIGGANSTSGTPLEPAAIRPIEEDDGRPPGKILRNKKMTIKQARKEQRRLLKNAEIVVQHMDIIGDKFWIENPYIMGEGTE